MKTWMKWLWDAMWNVKPIPEHPTWANMFDLFMRRLLICAVIWSLSVLLLTLILLAVQLLKHHHP